MLLTHAHFCRPCWFIIRSVFFKKVVIHIFCFFTHNILLPVQKFFVVVDFWPFYLYACISMVIFYMKNYKNVNFTNFYVSVFDHFFTFLNLKCWFAKSLWTHLRFLVDFLPRLEQMKITASSLYVKCAMYMEHTTDECKLASDFYWYWTDTERMSVNRPKCDV